MAKRIANSGKKRGGAQKRKAGSADKNVKNARRRRKSNVPRVNPVKELRVGEIAVGRVDFAGPSLLPPSLTVLLKPNLYGRVCITQLADRSVWADAPLKSFKNGQFVKCAIIGVEENGRVELSMKDSVIASAEKGDAAAAAAEGVRGELPKEGDLVHGYVTSTGKSGCFVRLGQGVVGRALLRNLSDTFVKNAEAAFPAGKLVAGRVLKVDAKSKRFDLSLKLSDVAGDLGEVGSIKWTWGTIVKDAVIDGIVKRVESFGVFVQLLNSTRLTGLCHISQASDEFVKDLTTLFSPGDKVRALVTKLDHEKKKISLGLKASLFQDSTEATKLEVESDDESEEENAKVLKTIEAKEDSDDDGEESEDENDVESDGEEEDEAPKKNTEEAATSPRKSQSKVSLADALKRAREEKGDDSGSSDSDSDSDEEEAQGETAATVSRSAKSRAKESRKKQEEAAISEKEKRGADGVYESGEDFERIVLSNPNSSLVWIKYMSFLIAQTEIEAARAVAERALKTINFRKEDERFNVWAALLNMEHKFGSAAAAWETLQRMSSHGEPKAAYLKAADMYSAAEDFDWTKKALAAAKKHTKSQSRNVWMKIFQLGFDAGDAKKARDDLSEALRLLPKRKNARTIMEFARIEFTHKNGDIERGRTLCEGLIAAYPKRSDIWHQFIDMEYKYGGKSSADGDSVESTRRLLGRATAMKFSTKKMKGFFKKWMKIEAEVGTAEDVEHVKTLAREFVESLVAQ